MDSQLVIGLVFASVSGLFLSIQAGCNSTLGRQAGRSFSSLLSFSTGLVVMLLFFFIDVVVLQNKSPFNGGITKGTPWWSWTGGPQGAFYVVTTILFSELIGAATLMGSVVCAQLVAALVLDTFGWVGFPKRTLSWPKVLGMVLMIAGLVLVAAFRGTVVQEKDSLEPMVTRARPMIESQDKLELTITQG